MVIPGPGSRHDLCPWAWLWVEGLKARLMTPRDEWIETPKPKCLYLKPRVILSGDGGKESSIRFCTLQGAPMSNPLTKLRQAYITGEKNYSVHANMRIIAVFSRAPHTLNELLKCLAAAPSCYNSGEAEFVGRRPRR